jgi:Fur family ferric uptake transcriptional regulator
LRITIRCCARIAGYEPGLGTGDLALVAKVVVRAASNPTAPDAKLVASRMAASRSSRNTLPEHAVRLTRQRKILLDLIDKTGQHLDAERLYQLAKEKDPKLNRVTVYRTLKLLKEGGLVDELDLMHQAGEQHYYETRRKQEHAHVICLGCGKVEEFFGEPLQRLRKQIETHFGFQIVLARTEVGGYCPHCQSLRAQEVERAAAAASHP